MARSASHPFVLLKRGVRRGILTIRRERGWLTTLGALVGVTVAVQLLLALLFGAWVTVGVLRGPTTVRVEIRALAGDSSVQMLFGAVRALPDALGVTFVTREQAAAEESRSDPDLAALLAQRKLDNPFPDVLVVTLQSSDDVPDFQTFIRDDQWAAVVAPASFLHMAQQMRQADLILELAEAACSLLCAFLLLMLGVLLFVLVELVRRRAFARREEVLVENISGAQALSVLIPFATEGTILIFSALVVSTLLLVALFAALPTALPQLSSGELQPFVTASVDALPLAASVAFLVELLAIPLVALLGAWFGMRPFLRSPTLKIRDV